MSSPDTAGLYAPGLSWYGGANQHRSTVGAANAMARWHSGHWTFSGAVDARTEAIQSNQLGQPLEEIEDGSPYIKGESRQNLDAYASVNWANALWEATATLGVNANSRFGDTLLPAAQVVRKVGEHARLFASAGRSVRHPSFTDLYYNLGGAVGSENLRPECANQAEAGVRFIMRPSDASQLFMEVSRFYRQGTNLIDWIRYDGSPVFEAANLSEIQFQGGDISVQYTEKAIESLRVSMARLSATWMDADRTSAGFTSNYVLDFVRVKYDALIRVEGRSPVALTLRGSMQDRNGVAMVWEDSQLLQLWGAEVAFKGDDGARLAWRGSLRLDNLFDVQYADRGSVLQPGRMVRFGLTFEWKE
jgi:iron complex outermembrane receptor protein